MYYLRTRPAASAIQFTVDRSVQKAAAKAVRSQNAALVMKTPTQSPKLEFTLKTPSPVIPGSKPRFAFARKTQQGQIDEEEKENDASQCAGEEGCLMCSA